MNFEKKKIYLRAMKIKSINSMSKVVHNYIYLECGRP